MWTSLLSIFVVFFGVVTEKYASTSLPPPIVLSTCSSNSDCRFSNSVCNTYTGVCHCNSFFILVSESSCQSVYDFRANMNVQNVTETSMVVAWNTTYYPGVEVYFTITFNGTMISNGTSPHLIGNLTDGEVHSIHITSHVTGRDTRKDSVVSILQYVRTVPRQPTIIVDPPYNAPNVTIRWEPINLYFRAFYIYFTGPGVNNVTSTSDTNITFTDLKHGTIYSFTIVQETDEPYRRNSSELTKQFRTEPSVPDPPIYVGATAGQRNITVNITDTDMPNGYIIQYIFQLTYKVYSDEADRHGVIILPKKYSGIYILDSWRHIFPGAVYTISVFTVNDRYKSSTSTDIAGIETFPDVPGEINRNGNEVSNLTTTSGSIRWGRPVMPNGVMVAYRAILKEGPDVTCRIYQFCIAVCNNTLLGPPNDTCRIQNDTSLEENQREMSLDINNLRLGTTYTIQVIGYTTVGPGKKVEISLKTLSIVPNAIEDGSIAATYSPGNRVLNVTWSPPSFPGEDLEYTLVLRDAIRSQILVTQSNLKDPQYRRNYQLHNFYNYTVTVTPSTSAGAASISRPFSFTTRPSGRLGRPQNLKIKILRCDSVEIAWEEANVEDRNGPITGYEFQTTLGTQKWTATVLILVPNPNFWSISNREFSCPLKVQEKSRFTVTIFAVSDIINQKGVEYSQVFSTEDCVPGEVNRIQNEVYNQTTSSGSIRWGRPVMPNGVMVAYRAKLKEGPDVTCRIYQFCIVICNISLLGPPNDTCHIQNDTSLEVNQKEMSFNMNNLRLGTTYTVQVIGYTTVGPGKKVEISLKTLSLVPNAIEDGSIAATYSPGNRVLNVTWSPPSFPGEDLEYTLVLRDAIRSQILVTQSNLKDPQYRRNYQLHNFYNYTVTVTPSTSAGAASISRPFSFTTRPSGRLGRPQNLKIKILRCDSVEIAWEEANVEDRNGPITGYEFQTTLGTQKWTATVLILVPNPNFWSISNREFSCPLKVQEKSRFTVTIFAVSDIINQKGVEYSQVFSTEDCGKYTFKIMI